MIKKTFLLNFIVFFLMMFSMSACRKEHTDEAQMKATRAISVETIYTENETTILDETMVEEIQSNTEEAESILEESAEEVEETTEEYVYVEPPKGDIPERSYDSFRDFPHENMEYADDETYAFLKSVYDNIDFYGEIKTCDLSEYGDYIQKFKELLNNEVTFYDSETGENAYVKDYVSMNTWFLASNEERDTYNPHGFLYYVFDMDGDGTPELCMYNYLTWIFKYDKASDSLILWERIQTSYEKIQATRYLRWNWGGERYTLCELDENAELAMGVFFLIFDYSEGAISHLITVPTYYDESKQIHITDKMKKQAYFCEDSQLYMFNVTEEQFNELTEDFMEAGEQSEEKLKEVCYSYDDLFNNGNDCETCRENEEFFGVGKN